MNWVRTEDGVATASVELDTGPRSRFGSVVFSGLRRLDAADLQRVVPFREGDRYERRDNRDNRGGNREGGHRRKYVEKDEGAKSEFTFQSI